MGLSRREISGLGSWGTLLDKDFPQPQSYEQAINDSVGIALLEAHPKVICIGFGHGNLRALLGPRVYRYSVGNLQRR